MRIGFRTSPQNTDWASLDAAWAEAGRHDVFDSGWLNDHLTDPNRDRGGPSFETMTTLAALAHHVPGKSVGQTVLAATFRHPAMLAKEAVTLDHVTGGRYILALGAGWHVGEHESFGIDLPTARASGSIGSRRRSRCFALCSATRRGHAPGVTLDAPPYRLDGAVMEPGPVQDRRSDIWLGGQGPRGLRLAARYADGWNYASNLAGTLDGFIERRDRLRAECEAIGRDPADAHAVGPDHHPGRGEPSGARPSSVPSPTARAGASEILLTTPARDRCGRDPPARDGGGGSAARRVRLVLRLGGQPAQRREQAVDVGLGREVVDDPGTQPGRAAQPGRRQPAVAGRLERRLEPVLVRVELAGARSPAPRRARRAGGGSTRPTAPASPGSPRSRRTRRSAGRGARPGRRWPR